MLGVRHWWRNAYAYSKYCTFWNLADEFSLQLSAGGCIYCRFRSCSIWAYACASMHRFTPTYHSTWRPIPYLMHVLCHVMRDFKATWQQWHKTKHLLVLLAVGKYPVLGSDSFVRPIFCWWSILRVVFVTSLLLVNPQLLLGALLLFFCLDSIVLGLEAYQQTLDYSSANFACHSWFLVGFIIDVIDHCYSLTIQTTITLEGSTNMIQQLAFGIHGIGDDADDMLRCDDAVIFSDRSVWHRSGFRLPCGTPGVESMPGPHGFSAHDYDDDDADSVRWHQGGLTTGSSPRAWEYA